MPVLKHIALVKFKPGTSDARIQEIFLQIKGLKDQIPGILDFAWGPNNSPEGLSQGFTHGFIMTLQDAAARDAYLPHPIHEKLKANVLPDVESVIIFDFEA